MSNWPADRIASSLVSIAPLSFKVLGPALISVKLGLLLLSLLPLLLAPPVAIMARKKTPTTPTDKAKALDFQVLAQPRVPKPPLPPLCIKSRSEATDMDLLLGMGLLCLWRLGCNMGVDVVGSRGVRGR